MINLWVITPLQAAIFDTGPVNITEKVVFSDSIPLMPSVDQAVILDQSVINSAFAIIWLRQSYPAYTTPEYALLPFSTNAKGAHAGSATNWTGTTYKLTTELDCWKPTLARDEPASLGSYNFDNGRGCRGKGIDQGLPAMEHPYRMLYIGYADSPYADYSISGPNCSSNASHQFLTYWSKAIDAESKDREVAALFCEAKYYKQKVSVTVSLPGYVPVNSSIRKLAPREDLPETKFNQTAFESLLHSGVSMVMMDRD